MPLLGAQEFGLSMNVYVYIHRSKGWDFCHRWILNPLQSGGVFHPHILEEFICFLRGIRCIFLGSFGSRQKLLLANSGDPDQTPHYAESDLGLHCLPLYPS